MTEETEMLDKSVASSASREDFVRGRSPLQTVPREVTERGLCTDPGFISGGPPPVEAVAILARHAGTGGSSYNELADAMLTLVLAGEHLDGATSDDAQASSESLVVRCALLTVNELLPDRAFLCAVSEYCPAYARALMGEALAIRILSRGGSPESAFVRCWMSEVTLGSEISLYKNSCTVPGLAITPFAQNDPSTPVCSTPLPDAKERLYSSGLLTPEVFASGKVVAAGGAVLNALTGARTDDIDLFFHSCVDSQESTHVLESVTKIVLENIRHQLARLGKEEKAGENEIFAIKTANALTLEAWTDVSAPGGGECVAKVQFVLKLCISVHHCIAAFDLGPCKFAFDGQRFLGMHTALLSVKNLITLPSVDQGGGSAKRALKYHSKGFTYTVPYGASPTTRLQVDDTVQTVEKLSRQGVSKTTVHELASWMSISTGFKQIIAEARLLDMFNSQEYQASRESIEQPRICYVDTGKSFRAWMHANEKDPAGIMVAVRAPLRTEAFSACESFPDFLSAWELPSQRPLYEVNPPFF